MNEYYDRAKKFTRSTTGKWLQIIALLVMVMGAAYMGWNQLIQPEEDAFIIAVNPADDAASTDELYAPFVAHLSESMHMPVKMLPVADYAAVVEALKYGHADVARLGVFSYVMATEEADVEAILVGIKQKTGTSYRSYIITQPGVTDLNGATFAYVDVGSGSGYLAPSVHIKQEGIELGEVMFAGTHPAVIMAVKNGSVTAGAVADNRYDYAIAEGVIAEDELQIFWVSDPIPNSPWVVRKDMDPELRQRVVDAFVSMPEEVVLAAGVTEIGYAPASDEDYEYARELQMYLEGNK